MAKGGQMRFRLMKADDLPQVLALYRKAFTGPPWFQDWSIQHTEKNWIERASLPNFVAFVAEFDGEILGLVGGNRFENLDQLEVYLGRELVEVVETSFPESMVFYESAVFIAEHLQGFGLATTMREHMYMLWKVFLNKKTGVVLSRMREDNVGALRSAQKLNFKFTGVSDSELNAGKVNQYWYKQI